jgi:alkanesulfonate monooxygenase SsuD/methylene tetrahydromethanopterin reductase-like flavin-dependent oxidoreductase (luciferase family)
MVTMLDVISGGRAWLGIGAAHYSDEVRGLGIPFPPLRERFERLDEALQICLRMWSGERGDQQPCSFANIPRKLDILRQHCQAENPRLRED